MGVEGFPLPAGKRKVLPDFEAALYLRQLQLRRKYSNTKAKYENTQFKIAT